MSPTLLVTGATGKQGSATVQQLLALKPGASIRALTRNPASEAAKKLQAQGVEAVKGDFNHVPGIEGALKGVDAVLLAAPMGPDSPPPVEEGGNGKDVFDTAKRLKLPYLVLSSVASADKNSGVPHFDSKFAIEKHLAASGIPHAIIQPAMFYDNLPKTPEPLGFWKTAIPTQSIQMVACRDIRYLAAQALTKRDQYEGRTIALAADEQSIDDIAQAYKEVKGTRPDTTPLPQEALIPAGEDMNHMFKFLRDQGYEVDIGQIRKEYPHFLTFKEWLQMP